MSQALFDLLNASIGDDLHRAVRRNQSYHPALRKGGKPGRAVDSQKQRLYAAEADCRSHPANKPLTKYDRKNPERMVRDAQRFLNTVMDRKTLRARYPKMPKRVRVKYSRERKSAWAYAWTNEISFPLYGEWAWTRQTALHELAHVICDKEHGTRENKRSHDRFFCRVYVDLCRSVLGKEFADALKREMKVRRIKYSKPRTMTQEQRDAAAARLIAARAAKAGTPALDLAAASC